MKTKKIVDWSRVENLWHQFIIYVILFFWFEPASWAQWHIFFCILLCEKLFLKHVLSPVLLVCSSWMKSQIRRKRGINRDEIGRLRKMSLFSNKYLSFSTSKCHIFSREIGGTSINDVRRFSMIFDLPTTMSMIFTLWRPILGSHFGPKYPKIGRH